MNNKKLFNYSLNAPSYVKTILDILPEEKVSRDKRVYIIEIFNYIFDSLNKDELTDVIKISIMFQEQLATKSREDIFVQAKYLYDNFLERMLFDSYNRKMYFDIMNECIKVSVGYYQEISDNKFYEFYDNAICNIRMR